MHTATYRAILQGDRLEWQGEVPPESSSERSIPVDVSLVSDPKADRGARAGHRMATALESVAASGAVADLHDPVEWQRSLRRDRALPDRDE